MKGTPQIHQPNPKNPEGNQQDFSNRVDHRQGRPRKWTDEIMEGICDKFEKWLEQPKNFYVYDFYYEVNIRRGQVDHLRRTFPRFAELHLKAKEKEENIMFKAGIADRNPQFLKWSICTHHGYRMDPDGQQQLKDLLTEALKEAVKTTDFSDGKTPKPLAESEAEA